MNWGKFFSNIGGVAIVCAGAQHAMNGASGAVDWKAMGIGVAMCVAANLLGLFQQPPHTA